MTTPFTWIPRLALLGAVIVPAAAAYATWGQESRTRTLPAAEYGLERKIVQYGDPSVWQLYRGYIVAGGSAIFVQALLVGWLLVERRRRYRAETEVGRRLQEARTQLVTIAHLDRRAAIGEVTSAITHELNQPLEAILHNAEAGELLVESGEGSLEEVRQIFADIRRIDMRAAEMIQRLRGLLRKRELETRPIDVNELTRDTVALVTPVAGSRGVRVDLVLAINVVPIVGDPIHLQQVLLNMLLNGIEAMSATPRERRVLVVRTMTADDHIEISVSDFGHGIPVENVARIFEPFYTTKGEGMGLGLSIARTIVEAHGGRIAARNNDDGGATVSFMVPSVGEADDRFPRDIENEPPTVLEPLTT